MITLSKIPKPHPGVTSHRKF